MASAGVGTVSQPCPGSHRRQRGAILLLLLLPLVSLVLQLRPSRLSSDTQRITAEALYRAREALISHAVSYADRKPGRYGVLPCPDIHARGVLQEGIAHGSCGGRHVNSLGRLPWKTLGIEPLRDGAGECLWYAVTGAFKPNPAAERLNHDTLDGLRVYGGADPSAAPQPAAAVIIAPGAPILDQDRRLESGAELCGGHYQAAAYLEAVPMGTSPAGIDNAVLTGLPFAIDYFADAAALQGAVPNDRIVYLSAREIFAAVAERGDFAASLHVPEPAGSLLQRVAECLAAYANSHINPGNFSLPWPARPQHKAGVSDDDHADSGTVLFGHVPDRVDDSNAVLGGPLSRRLVTDCTAFTARGSAAPILWKNWRDHLYYAVGDAYQPRPSSQNTPACGVSAGCVALGIGGPPMAALLWFAGPAQPRQDRRSGAPEDYLEGQLPGYPDQNFSSYVPAADSNDSVYCLAATAPLTAAPCP